MISLFRQHFSFYAFVVAVIAMIVINLLKKPTREKVLDETLSGWYIQKKETVYPFIF